MSSTNEFPPQPILALTPSLVAGLRERTQTVLSYLVQTNSISTFFKESEILAGFRGTVELNDNDGSNTAFETFHDNVPLSVYGNYLPFVSRLFEKPCRMSSIENLMSSGLPELIAHSAGTSSGATKHFPKYRHPEHMSTSTLETMRASSAVSNPGGKSCIVYSLRCLQVVEGMDDDGNVKLKMPVCLMSTVAVRMSKKMHVDRDPFFQTLKVPDQSSPIAVSFISNYKSFLFMHALFALYEPQVELINTMFSTNFRDFCRTIDEEWDMLVECIDTGSIPDSVDVGHLKDQLLKFLPPNPKRAAELRKIPREVQSPGWLTKIWPGLQVVVAISSGPFQTVVPEIRHHIGPEVQLRTLGINCSEAFLALAYDHRDPSLYKVVGSDDIIEFLPIDAPEESKYVAQSWNVEVGRKYEVVLTTRDGLWRYRLGDVIEVVGFDPRDGQPIIHYVERRGADIRLAHETVTGQELSDALHSTSDSFGAVSEFCVGPDLRETVPRYCFFVELRGELGPSPTTVSQKLHAYISRHNENYQGESQGGKLAPPSVHVLRQGTFGEFRDWKVRVTGMAAGQIKVPLVVWDEELRNWLAERVIQEF
ncbi:GH3 auxin-responsive promoter [Boletus coccyginus]|nr:GH3 auxin-responsive promoter [Boletus coccyginus]